MQRISIFSFLFLGAFLIACNTTQRTSSTLPSETHDTGDERAAGHNQLTSAEVEAGWSLLFDGKTTNGWRTFKKDRIGQSWKADGGKLMLVTVNSNGKSRAIDGGDILSEQTYGNFELSLDWMVKDCGNSGIIFYAQEMDDYDRVWKTGPEMQILDNSCHPDAKIHKHRAGDLYDLIPCSQETVKPAGEWNNARIRIIDGKGTFWLNGTQVVNFDMNSQEWKDMIAQSKFAEYPGFGKFKEGHIVLQDHGDPVAFRNIKIRRL